MASGGDKDKGGKKKLPKNLTDPPESVHEIDSTNTEIGANLPPEEDQSNGEQNRDLGANPPVLRVDLPKEDESKGRNRGPDRKALKLDFSKEGKSKGRNRGQNLEVGPKIRTSRSWAQASTSKERPCDCPVRTSPPRTRSQSKSPGRKWLTFRSKSKSPMKPYHKPWHKDEESSETEPLLDHPDGIPRPVPSKVKKVKETKPTKIKFENKHIQMADPCVSDEEKSQTSTISSQSSSGVAKATGKLDIGDSSEAEEMEDEPQAERKGSSESASSRGKKKKSSEESKKKDKSKK